MIFSMEEPAICFGIQKHKEETTREKIEAGENK